MLEQLDELANFIRERGFIILIIAVIFLIYVIINFLILKNA